MDQLCRVCKGSPKVFSGKPNCVCCKKTHADWVRGPLSDPDNFEAEINEMLYLHSTWRRMKRNNQLSTGIYLIDEVIVYLFGMPTPNFGTIHVRPAVRKVAAYTPPFHALVFGHKMKDRTFDPNKV